MYQNLKISYEKSRFEIAGKYQLLMIMQIKPIILIKMVQYLVTCPQI